MPKYTWENAVEIFAITLQRGIDHPWAIHSQMILDLIEQIRDLPEFNGDVTIGTVLLTFTLSVDGQYPMVAVWGENKETYAIAIYNRPETQTMVSKHDVVRALRNYMSQLRLILNKEDS